MGTVMSLLFLFSYSSKIYKPNIWTGLKKIRVEVEIKKNNFLSCSRTILFSPEATVIGFSVRVFQELSVHTHVCHKMTLLQNLSWALLISLEQHFQQSFPHDPTINLLLLNHSKTFLFLDRHIYLTDILGTDIYIVSVFVINKTSINNLLVPLRTYLSFPVC